MKSSKTYHIARFFLSLVLFVGGIAILILRIPFWSLVLGIPAIQIGIIFIIFSFDQLGKWTIENHLENIKEFDEAGDQKRK